MKYLVAIWFICCAGMAAAQSRDALIQTIVQAATHTHASAKHSVQIDGCQMTTFVWKPWEGQGMKLWSSFVFDMRMTKWASKDGNSFLIAIDDRLEASKDEGMVLIRFKMLGDAQARHEVPAFRKHDNKEHRRSPRQGYVPFFYRESKEFFILHQGAGVVDQATQFTAAYDQYVAEYCRVIG